ncbi:hypothetical protein BC830DRAFT_1233727 [Chytriomyces sp. MP71]|nr:hypothetical protein BC830DRAFT_1233727 [Chytriomyces sp. MP71]
MPPPLPSPTSLGAHWRETEQMAASATTKLDPARPSYMSVRLNHLTMHPGFELEKESVPKLRLKFRSHEQWMSLDGSADFVMTYHSHLFDKLKVDLFSVTNRRWLTKKLKPDIRIGRVRIPFHNMENWHRGTFTRSLDFLMSERTDAPVVVGTVELEIKFTPILHTDESEPSTENLRAAIASLGAYDSDNGSSGDNEEGNELEGDADSDGDMFFDAHELTEAAPLSPASSNNMKSVDTDASTRNHFLRANIHNQVRKAILTSSKCISTDATVVEIQPDNSTMLGRAQRRLSSLPVLSRTLTTLSRRDTASTSSSKEVTSPHLSTTSGSLERQSATQVTNPTRASTITVKKSRGPKILTENSKHNLDEISDLVSGLLKEGFDLPLSKVVRATQFIYKFENGLPINRTDRIVKEVPFMKFVSRLMDHALVIYGPIIFGFSVGFINPAEMMRTKATEKTAVEYLKLSLDNVLHWDHSRRTVSSTPYFIMHDPTLSAIVICCQGTITAIQAITDLNCEYFPCQNGSVHKGMLRGAQEILEKHLEQLLVWCRKLGVRTLYCTGHSLGAGTAALLTILLDEQLQLFRDVTGIPDFIIHGHGFATPGVVTRPLAERCERILTNYVMEADIVPRLSYGTAAAFKALLIEASAILDQGFPEEDAFHELRKARVRVQANYDGVLGLIPGKVYHYYKTVRKIPRRHHGRYNVNPSLFKKAYNTIPLPDSEKPEVPHYVMAEAERDFFAYIAPRRHILNHHMPWQYTKSIQGALEWVVTNPEQMQTPSCSQYGCSSCSC